MWVVGYRVDILLDGCDLCACVIIVPAVTQLVEMEGYGHAYIGPFNPALCHAATLMAQHWEAGLASPGCLNSEWPSLPPITPTSQVLFAVLRFFRWAHVGVISGKWVWLIYMGRVSGKWVWFILMSVDSG